MKKDIIKEILGGSDSKAKLNLFSFDSTNDTESIYQKYVLFSRSQFGRYFQTKSAPFHKKMILNEIKSYMDNENYLNIAFRGSSKTTGKKLFVVFVLLNDIEHRRKYLKIMTRDIKNAKQIVTDVFNLLLELEPIYGNKFEQESEKKTEKTMSSFTMTTGVKFTAGTVGQTQRGHIQDAYRPDWIWFDDVEDSESIESDVITAAIIKKVDEAIQGLAFDGNWTCTANYISDIGVIENLKKKASIVQLTPIMDESEVPTWERYTKEKLKDIKANAEDWYGDYMCLKPDTLILTDTGWKEIQSLSVGDIVISHKNRKKEVLKVFENNSDDLLDITVNDTVITITKNHPVLTIRNSIESWINAGELNKDDLVLSIPRCKLNTWTRNTTTGQL